MNGYIPVFYVEFDLHLLKSVYAKVSAEVDLEASEASGMELFTAEVSG